MQALNLLAKNLSANTLNQSCIFISADPKACEEAISLVVDSLKLPKSQVIAIAPEVSGREEIVIGSIRKLKSELSRSAISGKRLVIVRSADKLSTEAANSFLKTLEEPPSDTMIVLLADSERVIPTIMSRCQKYYLPSTPKNDYLSSSELEDFLKKDLVTMLLAINSIVERNEGGKFVDCLLNYFRQKLINDQKYQKVIESLLQIKEFLMSNANEKLILENLALEIVEN